MPQEELGIELSNEELLFLKDRIDSLREVVERMRPVNLNMMVPQARVFAWWRETLDFGTKDLEDKVAEWIRQLNTMQENLEEEKTARKSIVKLKYKKNK